jgi:hypothetical protein
VKGDAETFQLRNAECGLRNKNPISSSNRLDGVLQLCRAAVLQLNYLTATQQNGSTAALIDSMNSSNSTNSSNLLNRSTTTPQDGTTLIRYARF